MKTQPEMILKDNQKKEKPKQTKNFYHNLNQSSSDCLNWQITLNFTFF